ncbi:MAG: hypothetical protein ABIJ43_02965 [Candidatus Beckwithbacteria bacterium]
MPKVVPQIAENPRSGPEVKDFYNVQGKRGQREVSVGRIHKRQKGLIERIVTVWDQDQKKTGHKFTSFQERIIKLHNNKENFDGDPENTTRLLAFLTVFGKNNYSPAEISTLTGGTFKDTDEVSNLLVRAYAGDAKWKLGLGKISLKRESNSLELAKLTREQLQKEQKLFRSAILPLSNLQFPHKMLLGIAMRDKWLGHIAAKDIITKYEGKQLNFLGGRPSEKLAKFDFNLTTPGNDKKLLAFIEAGTSVNLENLITSEASEVSGKTSLIEQARTKGFLGVAEACSQDNLSELRKGGFQRHAETATDFNSLDDYRKYIHKNLTSAQASDFETIISVALNDPTSFEALVTHLGISIDSSPEAFLKKLDTLTEAQRTALVTVNSVGTVTQLKEGPWTLKIDAAHTLLLRRLDQISSEAEILPVLEKFEDLDLSKANPKQLVTLIAHGKKLDQLKDQKASEEDIKEAVTTFLKHNEDGKLILNASHKPQFKEGKEQAIYKSEHDAKKTPTTAQLTTAKTEVQSSLPDNHEEVTKAYHRIVKQQHADIFNREFTRLTNPPLNWENNRAAERATIIANNERNAMWDKDNQEPDNTYTNYNTLLAQAKTTALTSQPLKDEIAKKAQEAADKEASAYERQYISKDKLAELGTVSLAGLKQNPNAADLDPTHLSEPTKTEVETIDSADDFDAATPTTTNLKAHILANPSSVQGMDLAILFAIFGSLPSILAQNLNQEQQEQYKSSFI